MSHLKGLSLNCGPEQKTLRNGLILVPNSRTGLNCGPGPKSTLGSKISPVRYVAGPQFSDNHLKVVKHIIESWFIFLGFTLLKKNYS